MLQPIGLLFMSLTAFSFYRRPAFMMGILFVSTLFGTASLANAGGSSIIMAHAMAAFLTIRIALWAGVMGLLRPLVFTSASVFLLLLYIYAVLSGYFLPRFFAGATNTVSITEATSGIRVIQFLPLVPSGANVTQTFYLTLGIGAFCSVVVYLRRTMNFDVIISILAAMAIVHLVASLLDLLTFYSSTAALLGPVRNANWAYLCALEKGGLKRMCAFMSEASAFASYTLVVFAMFLNLWVDRVRTNLTGPIAALLFFGLMISTSGSGYVGFAMLMVIVVAGRSLHLLGALEFRRHAELLIAVFFAVCAAILALALVPAMGEALSGFLEETVFGKLESASGQERTLWNRTAMQNFFDTSMLGAGLGSTRASSIAVVLLSQVGIPGTAFFVLHILSLMLTKLNPDLSRDARALITAVRYGIVAHLIVAVLAKGDFVFPMLFYALCGIVVAGLQPFGARNRAKMARAAANKKEGVLRLRSFDKAED